MKNWQRLPLNIIVTALLSGLSYVLLVSVLNQGVGLGEPLWKGFLLQVLIHTAYTIIVLSVLVAPVYIISSRLTSNKLVTNIIINTSVFVVIMLLYTFMLSVSGYWAGIVLPCVVGVIVFYYIEYLTRHSSRRKNCAAEF